MKGNEFLKEEKDISNSEIMDDVIENFKKITGVEINSIFNKPKGGKEVDDTSIFKDKVVEKTFVDIAKYVKDKYDIDIKKEKSFLEDFDDKLSAIYPW